EIDDNHPQHALKITLEALGLDRRAVAELAGAEEDKKARARRALLREALAPPDRTADWLARLAGTAPPWGKARAFPAEACGGLCLIEARNEEEEATIVALLLREALEIPGRTAALATPDPALGERVAAKLRRWGVAASASAGAPLSQSAPGVLLTLLAELAEDE